MANTFLITGGAASGKTRWAATYLEACDYVLYLRSADAVDNDTLNRIKYGNEQHGVEWDIVTGAVKDPKQYITDHKFVIFDGLSSYTKGIMSELCPDPANMDEETRKEIERRVISDITEMYDRINEIEGKLIVITVETGFSYGTEDRAQVAFRDILGNVNQRIANMSDEVYFSASGIQFKIK